MVEAVIGVVGVMLGVVLGWGLNLIQQTYERKKQRRTVAKAMMFEIVGFYRYYYRNLRPILQDIDPESCLPPTISAPTAEFFAVYRANAATLGSFDDTVVEDVVRFYGLAQWLLSTIREYGEALAYELQRENSVAPKSAPRRLLKQIQTTMWDTDRAAVDAGRKLSGIGGVISDPFAKLS
jgi:hypothetical protein